jgi:putative methionine-R-sulfoxide reductase with GAF domain
MSYSASAGTGLGPERRVHPRKSLVETQLVTVDLTPPHATGPAVAAPFARQGVPRTDTSFNRGILINVSEGGLALQPFLPLTPGSTTPVHFGLPGGGGVIDATGIVTWVGGSGRVGIQFVDLPQAARAHLRQWMGGEVPRKFTVAEPVEVMRAGESGDELDLDATCELIAEHARRITSAEGVAIALNDGEGIVCRVSYGNAPDIGVRLQPDSGLTGRCVRRGELVYCVDALHDDRVDPELARSLNFRSVLVVPIFVSGNVSGLIELLSAQPEAFQPRHIARLQRMARLLSAAIADSSR